MRMVVMWGVGMREGWEGCIAKEEIFGMTNIILHESSKNKEKHCVVIGCHGWVLGTLSIKSKCKCHVVCGREG